MSPEAQRRAISLACGWKIINDSKRPLIKYPHQIPPGWTIRQYMSSGEPFIELPDYLNDLNAMHEAIMSRTHEERRAILTELFHITAKHGEVDPIDQVDATAAQRAEAFLRALGKWDDSK